MKMSASTATRMSYDKAGSKFASVSIPDLRSQQLEMIREGAKSGVPPLATTDEIQLEQIKNAINSSFRGSAVQSKSAAKANDWFSSTEGAELSQIEPLVDSILEHYPSGGTPIISIAASEDNPQLATTAARAASILRSKSKGRILLIDSDLDNGGLTYKLERVGSFGLTELILGKHGWGECVGSTSVTNVDFMPIGRSPLRQTKEISTWIGKALPHFKDEYEYVIVCAGDAHSKHGGQWCSNSSGAYLLVSMTDSNQAIAKSAVTHLQTHGSRLLGCVVSDIR